MESLSLNQSPEKHSEIVNSVGIHPRPVGTLPLARLRATDTSERRTVGLTVQFTPSERKELGEAARQSGAATGEFVRRLCLSRRSFAPIVAGTRRNPEAKALAEELRAIGNNLNQLARVANQTGELRREGELSRTLDILKAALARVIEL